MLGYAPARRFFDVVLVLHGVVYGVNVLASWMNPHDVLRFRLLARSTQHVKSHNILPTFNAITLNINFNIYHFRLCAKRKVCVVSATC